MIVAEPGPEEDYFSRRFGDLLHVDDPRRLHAMAAVGVQQVPVQGLDAQDALGLQMLAYQIDGRHEQAAATRPLPKGCSVTRQSLPNWSSCQA